MAEALGSHHRTWAVAVVLVGLPSSVVAVEVAPVDRPSSVVAEAVVEYLLVWPSVAEVEVEVVVVEWHLVPSSLAVQVVAAELQATEVEEKAMMTTTTRHWS